MFVIRQAKVKDVQTLAKLARMVYFINLPPNEQILTEKIQHSDRCFKRAAGAPVEETRSRQRSSGGDGGMSAMEEDSAFFMFVIEEIETASPVGTSQVRAHQGGPGNPNWSLKLDQRRFHSEQLGQGTTHTVAKLYGDLCLRVCSAELFVAAVAIAGGADQCVGNVGNLFDRRFNPLRKIVAPTEGRCVGGNALDRLSDTSTEENCDGDTECEQDSTYPKDHPQCRSYGGIEYGRR